VLAANGVEVMIAAGNEYTPSLVISHALLTHNRGRKPGLADGIVVTPSHHPPQDGGFNASWCESWVLPASRPSHARQQPPHPSPASVLTNAKAVACG
jgi:hypothetical protein